MVHGLDAPLTLQTGFTRLALGHAKILPSSPCVVAATQFEKAAEGSSLRSCALPTTSPSRKQSRSGAPGLDKCPAFELNVLFSSCCSHGLKSQERLWRRGLRIRVQGRDFGRSLECGFPWLEREASSVCDQSGREVSCRADLKQDNGVMDTQRPSDGQSATMSSSLESKSLWSKVMQSVNLSGVMSSTRVIVRDRHLAIPHVIVPDISWIDWKALQARGFQGVLFDKDNTLTAPYAQSIWPSLTESLEECREVFGGHIALLSNSAGLYQYDPNGDEAKALESQLSIPVIRHGLKKPAGDAADVSKHFGCDADLLIMVGDRYFTDIIYGNRNGLLTIRPSPLTTRGEPFIVKRVRQLEDTLVGRWRHRGSQAPKHKLCDNPVDFIKDPACW